MMRKNLRYRIFYFLIGCTIILFFLLLIQLAGKQSTVFVSVILDIVSVALLVVAIVSLMGRSMPRLFKHLQNAPPFWIAGHDEIPAASQREPQEEDMLTEPQQ